MNSLVFYSIVLDFNESFIYVPLVLFVSVSQPYL